MVMCQQPRKTCDTQVCYLQEPLTPTTYHNTYNPTHAIQPMQYNYQDCATTVGWLILMTTAIADSLLRNSWFNPCELFLGQTYRLLNRQVEMKLVFISFPFKLVGRLADLFCQVLRSFFCAEFTSLFNSAIEVDSFSSTSCLDWRISLISSSNFSSIVI